MRIVSVLLLVFCLCGCLDIKYSRNRDLPRAALMESDPPTVTTVDGIKIYQGYPRSPYIILGKFSALHANGAQLARFAKSKQADGIIIYEKGKLEVTTYEPYFSDNHHAVAWGVPGYEKTRIYDEKIGILIQFISGDQDRLNEVNYLLDAAFKHRKEGLADFDRKRHRWIAYSPEQLAEGTELLKKEKIVLEAKIAAAKSGK
jgi:hypothetical protein